MILRDIRLPVREATVNGYILHPDYVRDENPGLDWEVIVQTEEQIVFEETDDETFFSPRISWGEFSFPTMRRWFELEGKSLHFDAARNELSEPHPFSYFNTHELISSSTLKFVKRTGNKFALYWEGTCDPLWVEPYNTNVPFLIQTEAVFEKISVMTSRSDTDATTLERLSKYLDPADFIQPPLKQPPRKAAVENRSGIIEPLLRWAFGYPDTRGAEYGYSIFEPRAP